MALSTLNGRSCKVGALCENSLPWITYLPLEGDGNDKIVKINIAGILTLLAIAALIAEFLFGALSGSPGLLLG